MPTNPAQQLIEYKQSVWYDNISRDILRNGEVQRLIKEWGVRGMTSNPSIFDKAIRDSSLYDEQIEELKKSSTGVEQAFEEIAIKDIADAAELLKPIFDESDGIDGYVSIEVSPLLARDAKGTIEEARRLYSRLDRPNIMIKIPGTPECIPAIKTCLEDGININVTLLFSVKNYVDVATSYVEALTARHAAGKDISSVRSVASFFVSRVDSKVDAKLIEIIENGEGLAVEKAKFLLGKFGIANCKIAYSEFSKIFSSEAFRPLQQAGAKVQRPLWASTSTKNPAYGDVLYVEQLIGPDTVNTVPHDTLEAFVDHGVAKDTLDSGLEEALEVEKSLGELNIDISGILKNLQNEGVDKFSQSFEDLHAGLSKKLKN